MILGGLDSRIQRRVSKQTALCHALMATQSIHPTMQPLLSKKFFVRFLLNYAEQNGILLPGRVSGYSRSDIKLLPSSVSKRTVWREYIRGSYTGGQHDKGCCVQHLLSALAVSPSIGHHNEADDRPLLAMPKE